MSHVSKDQESKMDYNDDYILFSFFTSLACSMHDKENHICPSGSTLEPPPLFALRFELVFSHTMSSLSYPQQQQQESFFLG
ncbi:conserved hypothetical protein [Ricinus communis]|uniref:Uncharacterized protein n=1 Tax=Ricinus communis TaxID=3988 RepID=B9S8P5_RICCO|nr:conserved hypothetical protein [Ricinus communis]